ncbi:MAG: Ceramide glucosyltransferase [Myxococcaceae bacterium]|nr:Ceramide glucosyltransferase [Myxococcaceae bacterium]
MIITALLVCTVFASCFYVSGIVSALLHVRSRARTLRTSLPPLSLLKPVKGLEENLDACLRSFFEQSYPGPLELVFASGQRDDPAIAVARALAAEYPAVRTRFVLTNESWGLNPKVSNLQGALMAASHDLVLQTDANVWATPGYAHEIVSELLDEDAALLSSLVTGLGERSTGAAIENLQLTAYVAPACCAALKMGGVPCVIGKSMLFRKSELRALGGLELVKDSLAEDFLLGRHFVESGKKVLLSATPVRNLNVDMRVERSLKRHARWLKMRAVIHPVSFVADFLANPIALALLTFIASDYRPQLGFAALVIALIKTVTDGLMVRVIRGVPMRIQHVLLVPVKDLLMMAVWVYAIFSRSVEWRGIRFRIGSDSQLLPDEGNLPVRVLRRLLSVQNAEG